MLVTGCADEVAAPEGIHEPFSMYGILNPRLMTQTVLVSPVGRRLVDHDDSIDAVVTSTDLTTGRSYTWRDSVVTGERGQTDHVFVADFRPDFGSRHDVRVERSDGAVSTARIAVPGTVEIEFHDDGSHRMKGRVAGGEFRIVRAEATYVVRYAELGISPTRLCENMPRGEYVLPIPHADTEAGWELDLDLRDHRERLISRYVDEHDLHFRTTRERLALMELDIEITIGNEEWTSPGRSIYEFALTMSGEPSNVENGLGFIGGGYNQEASLWPSESTVEAAGFFDFQLRPPGPCLDLCSCGLFPE